LCPPLFKEEVPEGRRSSRDESIFSKKLEIAPNPPFPNGPFLLNKEENRKLLQ
jgi:hypothetical protein